MYSLSLPIIDCYHEGLHDTGMDSLTEEEVADIWSRFDHDSSGSIHYDEFLKSLRPPLNANRWDADWNVARKLIHFDTLTPDATLYDLRLQLIEKAFAKMDVTGDGVVNINDLKKCYSVKGNQN